MDETTSVPDDRRAAMTTTVEASVPVEHDAPATAEPAPRMYKALTERPADFEGFFVRARRQGNIATPTYKALTERPADFKGLFAPSRGQGSNAAPTYKAPTERPAESTDPHCVAA